MNISIGEVFRLTAVKVATIRYYEKMGLLGSPARTEGKQRRYGAADVARLNFIRHARELGFEVSDIRELLTLSTQPDRSCKEVDVIARRHLLEVDRRIDQLAALRGELRRMVEECGHGRVSECRVIETLSERIDLTARLSVQGASPAERVGSEAIAKFEERAAP